jgi:hypothetical protein
MSRLLKRPFGWILLLGLFVTAIGADVQCPGTVAARPSLADLQAQIDALEARVAPLEPPATTVVLSDDFENGIDPAWIQVDGTTRTITTTTGCDQAYWSNYQNCGSQGLHFDEKERYDIELATPSAGSLTLYFHDDPADTHAAMWIGVLSPGDQERLGVETSHCPSTYYISVNAGEHRCTIIPRRLGWHRIEFVRTATSTRGYLDYAVMFETNKPFRTVFQRFTVIQEVAGKELSGFAIDDVNFVAFGSAPPL